MRDLQCLHAAEGGVVIHQEIKAGRFQTPLPLFLAPEFRALRNRRFIGLFVKAAPMRVIQSIDIFLIARRAQEDEIADQIAWRERRTARVERLKDDLGIIFRSEEHTSELQSLMRISYAVFCLKKK